MAFPDVTTERLQLSRWDPRLHTPALEAINALPEAVRYLNAGVPYTPAETAAQSERFAAHWERYGFGLWGATLRSTGEVIGFVGVAHPLWFPAYADEVEVGWRLHPSFWGTATPPRPAAPRSAPRTSTSASSASSPSSTRSTPRRSRSPRASASPSTRPCPHPQRAGEIGDLRALA